MIAALTLLLVFQLVGETLVAAFVLPLPGPVLGLALLLAWLFAGLPRPQALGETAGGLLSHLSLLFVPAAVGIVVHMDRLSAEGPAMIAAVAVSTVLALAVGAWVFVAVARLTGSATAPGELKGGELKDQTGEGAP